MFAFYFTSVRSLTLSASIQLFEAALIHTGHQRAVEHSIKNEADALKTRKSTYNSLRERNWKEIAVFFLYLFMQEEEVKIIESISL